MYQAKDLAQFIDHTLLKPDAVSSEIVKICAEAKEYHFKSVCVNPCYTKLVAKELAGTDVNTCCVISFPFGSEPSSVKAEAAKQAKLDGADEIDMVINVGKVKEHDYAYVKADIASVVEAAKAAKVKVILETCYLTDAEIVEACKAAKAAKAAFVKTSTGYGKGGATVEAVKLMRETVGPDMGVKASGGIRSYEQAVKMIEAGANRIGASSGIKIVSGN